MKQAEEDGIVVEIKYEGRATDSEITDHDAMNHAFIDIFGYGRYARGCKAVRSKSTVGFLQHKE